MARPTEAPYVPGLTPRPPDGAYDHLRARADPVTTSVGAAENGAWTAGLRLLEDGWFWEAHEVLEQVWLNAPSDSAERRAVQAVIQIANAALKHKMARPKAAARCAALAASLADEARGLGGDEVMGVRMAALAEMAAALAVASHSVKLR